MDWNDDGFEVEVVTNFIKNEGENFYDAEDYTDDVDDSEQNSVSVFR